MKTKLFFLFLIFSLNAYAQTPLVLENHPDEVENYWQIMANDSSTFIFKNAAGEITSFQNIIHRVDTVVTDIGETEDYDFKSNGYIIIDNTLTAKDISKIIIYYQKRKVSKIAFYVEIYDNMGNYVGEEVLFWGIYR